jgi:hypothetical protein
MRRRNVAAELAAEAAGFEIGLAYDNRITIVRRGQSWNDW